MVRVDNRGASSSLGLGHAGLTQHPVHGAVVDPQLRGNRAHTPVLNEVIAKDLGIELFVATL